MAIKINSWVKNEKKELIPTCQANDMLNVNIEDEKYNKRNILEYCDVQLCWNYFERNYECYRLEAKYDGTKENYIYNLHNFQFSFRELDNSVETKKVFTMKKDTNLFLEYCGFYYVSDEIGFALLHLNVEELKVYYYDFEKQFSSTIKVQVPDFATRQVKLWCRSIWISTNIEDESYKGSLIDVINIKNEKEWYHIRSNACSPIYLRNIFSGIMLVADDIEDGDDDNNDFPLFSSCKVLYIDHDNLIPFETNQRNFIEFFKSKELEKENLLVYGIFKSTIILIDDYYQNDHIDAEFIYFLSYNDKLQLRFWKKIDLTVSSTSPIEIYWGYFLEIILEVGKMFLRASDNMVLVIDLRRFEVSQILEYASVLSAGRFFKWSKQDRMLNIKVDATCPTTYPDQRFHLKYGLFNGITLKSLALNVVAGSFSLEKIQSSNLPHSLVREILTEKMY